MAVLISHWPCFIMFFLFLLVWPDSCYKRIWWASWPDHGEHRDFVPHDKVDKETSLSDVWGLTGLSTNTGTKHNSLYFFSICLESAIGPKTCQPYLCLSPFPPPTFSKLRFLFCFYLWRSLRILCPIEPGSFAQPRQTFHQVLDRNFCHFRHFEFPASAERQPALMREGPRTSVKAVTTRLTTP